MKKGILVISFGTSYKETREKCIESVENQIRAHFKEYEIRRAFTSNKIISKLKEKDGLIVQKPIEALLEMIEEGFEEINVQPLHIIPGYEYEKVEAAVELAREELKARINLGEPLLFREHDYDDVIKVLKSIVPAEEERKGILLMGHGTEHFANASYSMLKLKIDQHRKDVYILNVEGFPKLEDMMDEIIAKFDQVLMLPLMLVAGDHAVNDMAGDDEESMKSQLESRGIEVECILKGMGEYEDIRNLYVQKITDMVRT